MPLLSQRHFSGNFFFFDKTPLHHDSSSHFVLRFQPSRFPKNLLPARWNSQVPSLSCEECGVLLEAEHMHRLRRQKGTSADLDVEPFELSTLYTV